MDSLYLVMPAYNEEANIGRTVRDWYPVLDAAAPSSRLVVADAGSTDRTHRILTELQKHGYPKLVILENTGKEHGPKLLALYREAVRAGADYIFQTDSDGQTDPRDFPRFWEERKNYDAVIARRPVRGDGRFRAFAEGVVCLLLRLIFGVRVPDANAPFRLMRTELAAWYLDRFEPDYALPNIMLTAFFAYDRRKLLFLPISFKPRQGGRNSVNLQKLVRIGLRSVREFRAFRKQL